MNSYTKQLIFVYINVADDFSDEKTEISEIPMHADKTKLETSMSDSTSPDMLPTSSKE